MGLLLIHIWHTRDLTLVLFNIFGPVSVYWCAMPYAALCKYSFCFECQHLLWRVDRHIGCIFYVIQPTGPVFDCDNSCSIGGIEVTGRRCRRRRKLLDDLKERTGYSALKEEAPDRTLWRASFGRGFGPVVRQNTK